MFIRKKFSKEMALPVEDGPGFWHEHLVLSARAGAGVDDCLQGPRHFLHHLGAHGHAGEVVHVPPLDGDLCRQQSSTYNMRYS